MSVTVRFSVRRWQLPRARGSPVLRGVLPPVGRGSLRVGSNPTWREVRILRILLGMIEHEEMGP